jgi:hypothetical protein
LAIKIDRAVLKQSCKEIIETILFCLQHAYKGTVYNIRKPPALIAERITSGVIDAERKSISWGLSHGSDYNPPGRHWHEYRDEPGRPLEAMAWCVEKQKSWTAEDPKNDSRSVRLQLEGGGENFHHMEPVLIRKEDFNFGNEEGLEVARNFEGRTLWEDSEYMVVAVIKIHFQPHAVKIGSPQTKVIKRLSRSLGTELLSYQLKHQSLEAMRQLAEDKFHSCNILADSLRNVITKSGLIFSLIKLELGSLRTQWERALLEHCDQKAMKRETVEALNHVLDNMAGTVDAKAEDLVKAQKKFLEVSLPPEPGENWVRMQIEKRWNELLSKRPLDPEKTKEIRHLIDQLKRSLHLGNDPGILARYENLPEPLKQEWVELIYRNTDRLDFQLLDRVIHVLEDPSLNLPSQPKSRKSLIRLKALAEIVGQLEDNTNEVLREVLNGHDNEVISNTLHKRTG